MGSAGEPGPRSRAHRWVHAAKPQRGGGSPTHLHPLNTAGTSRSWLCLEPCPWSAQPCVPLSLPEFPRSLVGMGPACWRSLGERNLWSRGKIPWEVRAVMPGSQSPLISIPRALHFFRREAPTFSSQSKYQALILCVNRLASAATDDCSFGKFIVAIK